MLSFPLSGKGEEGEGLWANPSSSLSGWSVTVVQGSEGCSDQQPVLLIWGEAHVCCLNTDREHVGSLSQCTTNRGQALVVSWKPNRAPPLHKYQTTGSAPESFLRKHLLLILKNISWKLCPGSKLAHVSSYTPLLKNSNNKIQYYTKWYEAAEAMIKLVGLFVFLEGNFSTSKYIFLPV